MLDQIKAHLLDSINDIVSSANQFVLHPEKDFSRKSQLTMKTMIQAILTMGGHTLSKELLDLHLPVTQSAFVQRWRVVPFEQTLVIMDRGMNFTMS